MSYPNDMSRLTDGFAGDQASNSGDYVKDPKYAARRLVRRTYVLRKPAVDAMASDTTAYTAADQIHMPVAGRVLGATLIPLGAATASDTTYATVNVVSGDGAGGAAVVAASITTKITGGTGNLVAGVQKAFTLSATLANQRFAKGATLGFNIAKASTGVVVPISAISVDVEEEAADDGYKV